MITAAPTAIRAGIGRDIGKGLQADGPRWLTLTTGLLERRIEHPVREPASGLLFEP